MLCDWFSVMLHFLFLCHISSWQKNACTDSDRYISSFFKNSYFPYQQSWNKCAKALNVFQSSLQNINTQCSVFAFDKLMNSVSLCFSFFGITEMNMMINHENLRLLVIQVQMLCMGVIKTPEPEDHPRNLLSWNFASIDFISTEEKSRVHLHHQWRPWAYLHSECFPPRSFPLIIICNSITK